MSGFDRDLSSVIMMAGLIIIAIAISVVSLFSGSQEAISALKELGIGVIGALTGRYISSRAPIKGE